MRGVVNVSSESGLYGVINNSLHGGMVNSFGQFLESGYQLWWNTPVDGLRAGASFCYVDNFDYDFTVPTGAPPPFPSHLSLRAEGTIPIQQYSLEYLWRNWTFQAEFYALQSQPGHGFRPWGKSHSFSSEYAWYADASYRFATNGLRRVSITCNSIPARPRPCPRMIRKKTSRSRSMSTRSLGGV